MLSVSDLKRTMSFYGDRLGFSIDKTAGETSPTWCTMSRDRVRIMFNQPPREEIDKLPAQAKDFQIYYFYPDDVTALHAAWKRGGLPVTDLRVTSYGMKEFELRDPDDYWLWFGQESSDTPTAGY